MKKKATNFDSSYRYNPLNPLNWSFFCKLTFILSILLIIDWSIGIINRIKPLKLSYIANIFMKIDFFSLFLPLIISLSIFIITPFLNDEMEGRPFYGAILIKVLLALGGSYFTLLGTISQSVFHFCCSFFIVFVLVFVIFFETEDASYYIQTFLIAIFLLITHFLFNLIVFGLRINEMWAIATIFICILGLVMIRKELLIIGSITILVIIIINDYFIPFGLSGFETGSTILKFGCGLLFLKGIGER